MRISILGAGAIGCYFAARLKQAGADVELIARGASLDAIRRDGIQLLQPDTTPLRIPVRAVPLDEARPADLLITAVKAYSLPGLASDIARLLYSEGRWLCAVNGLPWWYGARPLQLVDPGGVIRSTFPLDRTIGCVAYLRSETLGPGQVAFTGGKGLFVGMPDGSDNAVVQQAAGLFTRAGVPAIATGDIRSAVWNKLFGNVAMNPLSALTGCSVAGVLADAELKALLAELVEEAMRVAAAENCTIEGTPAHRIAAMVPLGEFRTSMLQDADANRPLELDAILGAMLEIAERHVLALPASRRLYALVRAFASSRGLMPAGI